MARRERVCCRKFLIRICYFLPPIIDPFSFFSRFSKGGDIITLITKDIFRKIHKRFPSFYGTYQPIEGTKVILFCTGEEGEEIKKEMQKFLEDEVSLLINPSFVFTKEVMTPQQLDSIFYN